MDGYHKERQCSEVVIGGETLIKQLLEIEDSGIQSPNLRQSEPSAGKQMLLEPSFYQNGKLMAMPECME